MTEEELLKIFEEQAAIDATLPPTVQLSFDDVAEFELAKIRMEREALLKEADIAILKLEDAGADASAWRTYRQALRDITKNPTYVHLITWPTKPE